MKNILKLLVAFLDVIMTIVVMLMSLTLIPFLWLKEHVDKMENYHPFQYSKEMYREIKKSVKE